MAPETPNVPLICTELVATLKAVCVPSAVCTLVKDVVTPLPVVLAFTVSIDLYVFDISLPLKSVIFRPTFYLQAANLYFL